MTFPSYHAHVYYEKKSMQQAKALCEEANAKFSLTMGRFHQKPVGPHPCWSCQLAFDADQFPLLVPWLSRHRNGLDIFIHPNSGDDYKDHTDFVMWLGQSYNLKLDIFTKNPSE